MSDASLGGQMGSVALCAWLPALWPPGPQRPPYVAGIVGSAASRHTAFGSVESGAAEDEPFGRDAKLARVEATLFVADGPITTRRLARAANLSDGTEARNLVRDLNRLYDEAGSAVHVEEIAGGFRLLTRPEFERWLVKLYQARPRVRLSGPALETLAIVAYRQPVLRADVEAIRGVQCGEMLRQLMEKDLVRIVGRDHTLGRPLIYGTTKKFLMLFGLKDLNELPMVRELSLPQGQQQGRESAEGKSAGGDAPSGTETNETDTQPGATDSAPAEAAGEPEAGREGEPPGEP